MFKYLAYFFAILKAKVLRRRVPILVTLCVTNRCNMRCAYCYEEYYSRQHAEIPKERILKLIDELAGMGTKYLSINGGEALLRDDLEDIVDSIKAKNMLCHLSSNGILVPSRLPLLRKIDSLSISIDGIGAGHDLNRGAGTYARVRAGLEMLAAEGIRFHTHTVLTKNNKDSVEDILALARELGFQAQFSLLRVEDSPDKTLALEDTELKPLIQRLLKYKKQGEPVFFSSLTYENYLNWPLPNDQQIIRGHIPRGFQAIPCDIKRFSCHIEANGLVYPCVVLVNKYPALNFLEHGFRKCWDRLQDNPCLACHNICCNDLNLIFALSPRSIWNASRIVFKRISTIGYHNKKQ